MSFVVNYFSAAPTDLSVREICRYMGMRSDVMDSEMEARIQRLLPLFLKEINCRACWMELPVSISRSLVDMELLSAESTHLARNLLGCDRAVVFAATIGIGADRLCKTALIREPSNALIYDAMASTAIEWFCDSLCGELSEHFIDYKQHPRFSPGYGDLPLDFQRDLIGVLDAQRGIGLTLTEHLMMIPQKSVTAIVGLKPNTV